MGRDEYADFKITTDIVPAESPTISEAVRDHVAKQMERHLDDQMQVMMTMPTTSTLVGTPWTLTAGNILKGLAEIIFDADIIVSAYVPTVDKDGVPVEAYVIENTRLPDWDMKCQIAKARGEPMPKARTIVFPSEDKMFEAIEVACENKKAPDARGTEGS